MAESSVQPDQMNKETERTSKMTKQAKLKYLDFVHVAAIQALVCVSRLYDWAKENSGPLKPGVQTVEGTVKTVVGPVYEKFRDLPFEILKFVDTKPLLQGRTPLAKGPSTHSTSAERYAVSAWKSLNKLPVFPQVAQVVLPTAAHWTEKYNGAVRSSAEKGYAFAGYLPVVPVERIAKVFEGNEKAE
ncbi:stress-related protein-like [Asparagus officinalis]|uniref:stress-related protein-like n=1 Tax=Asparagus officinalis TaxID=4686 RepID=UPI00098E7D8F|nr:stress-related protein-like [Asparagus officinalis]